MVRPVKKAVFPVAGLGTRFLPATKTLPKEMLTVVDKPLIQYAVEEAIEAGIEDLILITGRGKSIMEDHFDHAVELEQVLEARGKHAELTIVRDFPDPGYLSYTRQQAPLGLGHAVWCARQTLGDDAFAVLLPDDLIQASPGALKQMIEVYNKTGGNVVAIEDVPRDQTNRYGILDVAEDDGRVARAQGLVEKPDPADAPSTLSIIGRYILQPEVFDHLDKQERGAGNEIQLTDAMAATLDRVPFFGVRFNGRRFDCGTKLGFVAANVAFAAARDDLGGDIRTVLADIL